MTTTNQHQKVIQKSIFGAFILGCLVLPFFGCGSGGGDTTGTPTTGTTTATGGGRNPINGEKAGYLGRLVDNTTKQGISGATFVIGSQRAVTNAQGIFNLEIPNGSGAVAASLEVSQYQGYLRNTNISSLDLNGKSVSGCTNNKKFITPAVAKGLVL